MMIPLATTAKMTTSLGFGSSGLMAPDTNRVASLALLESAYEAGIRHFDVAPMYGLGAAEACVGEFLSRHRQDITIATKFGIAPAKNASLLNLARRLGKPILRQFPGLKTRLVQGSEAVMPSGTPVSFTAENARLSLDASLRHLRTDHVDVWLLHEAAADDLNDDRLLHFMEQAQAAGKIGTFGVGSDKSKTTALLRDRPSYCPVMQFEWSVLDATLPETAAFEIHHRSLTDDFRSIHAALRQNVTLCSRWSDATGRDLQSASELAALMLKAALERNAGSIILFSSKDKAHIFENARVAEDKTLSSPALILHALLQAEGSPSASPISLTKATVR